MLDWSFTSESVRDAFAAAAEAFSITVDTIPAPAWDQPGLGEWNIRDLTGHASRSLITVETYLAVPDPGPIARQHPVDYFAILENGGADAPGIVERGREAGRALGDDPAATVEALVTRVTALVDDTDDTVPVPSPAGVLRLIDYLPSRVLELVVHRHDLTAALGINAAEDLGATVERPAVQLAALLAAGVAVDRTAAPDLLLALTGRRSLPPGFSVV